MLRGTSAGIVAGVCTGAVAAANWQQLVKLAVKATIVGTATLTRTALRYAEDLVDVVEEARSELARAPERGQTGPPAAGDGMAKVTAIHGA